MLLTARSTASEISSCSVAARRVSVHCVVPQPASVMAATARTAAKRTGRSLLPEGTCDEGKPCCCSGPARRAGPTTEGTCDEGRLADAGVPFGKRDLPGQNSSAGCFSRGILRTGFMCGTSAGVARSNGRAVPTQPGEGRARIIANRPCGERGIRPCESSRGRRRSRLLQLRFIIHPADGVTSASYTFSVPPL